MMQNLSKNSKLLLQVFFCQNDIKNVLSFTKFITKYLVLFLATRKFIFSSILTSNQLFVYVKTFPLIVLIVLSC